MWNQDTISGFKLSVIVVQYKDTRIIGIDLEKNSQINIQRSLDTCIQIYKKIQALCAHPSSSWGGLGALLGAFGPLFNSRKCQTKHTQFSIKICSNNIFGGKQLMFFIPALQFFKQLIYSLLEKSKMAHIAPKRVP